MGRGGEDRGGEEEEEDFGGTRVEVEVEVLSFLSLGVVVVGLGRVESWEVEVGAVKGWDC